MAKLRPWISSLEEIPEDQTVKVRDLFTAGTGDFDGRFMLDIEARDGVEIRDTRALKKALDKERDRADGLERAIKPFLGDEGKPIDLDAFRASILAEAGGDNFDSEAAKSAIEAQLRSEFEGRMRAQSAQHEEAMQAATQRGDRAMSKLSTNLTVDALRKAFEKAGAGKHAAALARMAAPSVRMDEETFGVEVLDGEGQVRYSKSSGGTAGMTLDEFVAGDYRDHDDYASFFGTGDNTSGGGSGGGGGGGGAGGVPRLTRAQLSDPATYRQAMADAKAAGAERPIVID